MRTTESRDNAEILKAFSVAFDSMRKLFGDGYYLKEGSADQRWDVHLSRKSLLMCLFVRRFLLINKSVSDTFVKPTWFPLTKCVHPCYAASHSNPLHPYHIITVTLTI